MLMLSQIGSAADLSGDEMVQKNFAGAFCKEWHSRCMGYVYHPWMFLIFPLAGISCGTCDHPGCESSHYRLSVGWLCWTAHMDFSDEHS
jgi:hypothetical protein